MPDVNSANAGGGCPTSGDLPLSLFTLTLCLPVLTYTPGAHSHLTRTRVLPSHAAPAGTIPVSAIIRTDSQGLEAVAVRELLTTVDNEEEDDDTVHLYEEPSPPLRKFAKFKVDAVSWLDTSLLAPVENAIKATFREVLTCVEQVYATRCPDFVNYDATASPGARLSTLTAWRSRSFPAFLFKTSAQHCISYFGLLLWHVYALPCWQTILHSILNEPYLARWFICCDDPARLLGLRGMETPGRAPRVYLWRWRDPLTGKIHFYVGESIETAQRLNGHRGKKGVNQNDIESLLLLEQDPASLWYLRFAFENIYIVLFGATSQLLNVRMKGLNVNCLDWVSVDSSILEDEVIEFFDEAREWVEENKRSMPRMHKADDPTLPFIASFFQSVVPRPGRTPATIIRILHGHEASSFGQRSETRNPLPAMAWRTGSRPSKLEPSSVTKAEKAFKKVAKKVLAIVPSGSSGSSSGSSGVLQAQKVMIGGGSEIARHNSAVRKAARDAGQEVDPTLLKAPATGRTHQEARAHQQQQEREHLASCEARPDDDPHLQRLFGQAAGPLRGPAPTRRSTAAFLYEVGASGCLQSKKPQR
ncbi:hypothetical protein JCM10213_003050 [Rhodosporidiobolus nylandii]